MTLLINNNIKYQEYLKMLSEAKSSSEIMQAMDEELMTSGNEFLESKLRDYLADFPCRHITIELYDYPPRWKWRIKKACFWKLPQLWLKMRRFKEWLRENHTVSN